jgi:nitrogen fixation/metabolism regulation signal transduction histidine kinase
MIRIRHKIILILLLAVLLPLVPISILVYNLVNQSYQIGVNPQVQQALEQGVNFSKNIYTMVRKELSTVLMEFSQENMVTLNPEKLNADRFYQLGVDSSYWTLLSISFVHLDGKPVWKKSFQGMTMEEIDLRILKQFRPEQISMIVSDREDNEFIALQRVTGPTSPKGYLILRARMNDTYLAQSDHLLQVHQIFQSLHVTRSSLLKSFLYTFIAIALVLLSIVVIFGMWISGKIISPISQLVKGTAEVGKGNFDYQLPQLRRRDEFGKLIEYFNQMTQQLKINQERMIYLEKMAAWQQMARKIAHEIKNPLTPIQLTIQQLVDKYSGSDKNYQELLEECAQIITEEIGSLRQLVTEFSEFGRLPELQLQTGNFNEILKEVSTLYSQRVQLKLDDNLPPSDFDYDRIRRVFINLIENAIQADPAEKPVIIESGLKSDYIVLSVTDMGEGISPENLNRIFEPYFSTKKTGTGLGLAISRLIVEEHGGRISVRSSPGEGTKFSLKFPLKGKQVNEE